MLRKLKRDAESSLGEPVAGAVVTVPAYFSDQQRQAVKEAGQLAGLNVLRVINEPAAAVLASCLGRGDVPTGFEATVVVFDLGADSLDVSLLAVGDGLIEVKAISGDHHLGGVDWDRAIAIWLAERFRNANGVDLFKDKMAFQRLHEAGEKMKIELSGSPETQIKLPYITVAAEGPLDLDEKLTRAEFQRLTADLLERTRAPFDQVLKDAGIGLKEIDQVVMVGGSTRMPAVSEVVKELTGGKEPNKGIDPDEVVAIGACLQASALKDRLGVVG